MSTGPRLIVFSVVVRIVTQVKGFREVKVAALMTRIKAKLCFMVDGLYVYLLRTTSIIFFVRHCGNRLPSVRVAVKDFGFRHLPNTIHWRSGS